jgi:hypothetical protein
MGLCIVSFVDTEGIRHTVEVSADSLYEAAAMPGLITQIEVEIRSSITHAVTPKKIQSWLNGRAKSPKEAVLKDRLREMLSPHT